MKPPRAPVLILHHAIPAPGSCHNAESDAGVMDEVKIVSETFQALGIPFRIAAVDSLASLADLLMTAPERIIFNLVENFAASTVDAMQVPTLCEAFGRECTGNDSANMVLALDKWRTKAVLQASGLPVPAGIAVPAGSTAKPAFPPPWIVKPLFADASEGIHPSSVIKGSLRDLTKAIARIHRDFRHPALVESFFGTRELNVALYQQGKTVKIMPVAEIEFRGYGKDRPRIIDYAAKWHADSFECINTVRVVPAKLPRSLSGRLSQAALATWQALGCRDYARVDFRLDDDGNFAILEVNPNPDISPDSGFEAALKAAGIPYRDFVRAVYGNALERLARRAPASAGKRPGRAQPPRRRTDRAPLIRVTEAGDRNGILEFMRGTRFFHDGEIEVAREVLDEAIAKGPAGHYQSFTLLDKGVPSGWLCYGPTPCTSGTYDIYWIGVSASTQGRGYGRALLDHAEKLIRRKKGRLIIIETSGRPLYESTRGFYLKTGYREAARIPDFYGPADARVIYSKKVL